MEQAAIQPEAGALEDGEARLHSRLVGLRTGWSEGAEDFAANHPIATSYLAWFSDSRPHVRQRAGDEDKFADLVALGRRIPAVADYLANEVGVDATTDWRWSAGRSRPSGYLVKQITRAIRERVLDHLSAEVAAIEVPIAPPRKRAQ